MRVLGKIIDEVGLKRAMKANARLKKQARKAGLKQVTAVYVEARAAASKATPPSDEARYLVKMHNRKGYG